MRGLATPLLGNITPSLSARGFRLRDHESRPCDRLAAPELASLLWASGGIAAARGWSSNNQRRSGVRVDRGNFPGPRRPTAYFNSFR